MVCRCCCCCCCCGGGKKEVVPQVVRQGDHRNMLTTVPAQQYPVITGQPTVWQLPSTLVISTRPSRFRPQVPLSDPWPARTHLTPPQPVPTAPPSPAPTEYQWTRTRLPYTEPSVQVSPGCYVGRVDIGHLMLPAILQSSDSTGEFVSAHFFYKDCAGSTETFEVLSCRRTSWEPTEGGYLVPQRAIPCGRTASGRVLYFGRAYDEGQYHFGTADPEDGLLYSMAHGGTWYGCVRSSRYFDILVAA